MKRMYVTLAVMVLLLLCTGSLLAQFGRPVDNQDALDKKIELYEKMHRQLVEKLILGIEPDSNIFQDMEVFENEFLRDPFAHKPSNQDYSMKWLEDKSGRTLKIIPKTPDQRLDISVVDGLISIKGKSEQQTFRGTSVSNFSHSFSVPSDCNPSKVKIDHKDGEVHVKFPFTNQSSSKLKPLPPSDHDIQI